MGLHNRRVSRRQASGWLHMRTFKRKKKNNNNPSALVSEAKIPKATLAKNVLSADQ